MAVARSKVVSSQATNERPERFQLATRRAINGFDQRKAVGGDINDREVRVDTGHTGKPVSG